MKIYGCAAAMALAFAGGLAAEGLALAADLPALRGPIAPPFEPTPVATWTGCHAGLNVGGGWGRTQWNDTAANTGLVQGDFDQNNAGNIATTDMAGGVLGGQLGCDYQLWGNFVLGVEGKFSGSTISGTNVDQFNTAWSLHNNIDWFGSVTGRVGYAIADSVLIYARGGYGFADNQVTITNAGFLIRTGSLKTREGWTLGGGVEWAFAPHLSVFLEGNYYDYNVQNDYFPGNPVGQQNPFGAHTKQSAETLTVGMNYRMNWASTLPILAKY
jgi:outer membrane immunogenic protein